MARTRRRPLPAGEISSLSTLVFAVFVGGVVSSCSMNSSMR